MKNWVTVLGEWKSARFSSDNFFEVGIGFKTVHIAGHNLMAEGIVNLNESNEGRMLMEVLEDNIHRPLN